jgi:crotonobetainyl-CoA:carnitine CoA-transferase CaiB-like acyl-CoA transferase
MGGWLHLLTGARVLDLTKATSGPFGTQILADLGAEVVKVEESPSGPHRRDRLDPLHEIDGMDPFILAVNRNKKSVALTLSDARGLELFYELVRHADVVVNNYRPGAAEKLRVDYAHLREVKEDIICCSLSGYGATGPLASRAGFDLTLQAQTGMSEFNGYRDASGHVSGVKAPLADMNGGMYCAIAIPAALYHRARTGEGCDIEISMYDAVLSWFAAFAVYELNFGMEYQVAGNVLWAVYDTADRPLVVTAHRASQFQRFCRALGHAEWLEDERFRDPRQRVLNSETLGQLIAQTMRTRTAAEWIERFDAAGVAFAETSTVGEALGHPHTSARNMVVDVATAAGSQLRLLGNPIKVAQLDEVFEPPPQAGQHTREVLREWLGYDDERVAALATEGVITEPAPTPAR